MSVALIQGIPRRARVRVEALPRKNLVWKGVASSSLSLDLDPGKYIYKVHKPLSSKSFTGFCREFLHEINQKQFEKLQNLSPAHAAFRMTSEGGTYFCGTTGCSWDTMSGTAMVIHELEHKDLSLDDVLNKMPSHELAGIMLDGKGEKVEPTGTDAVAKPKPDSYVSKRHAQKQVEAAQTQESVKYDDAPATTPKKRGRPRKDSRDT